MSKPLLVVHTQPVSAEQEDAYNDWYNNEHLDDVVRLSGYRAAKRYVRSDVNAVEGVGPAQHKYLAIYELDTDDVELAATNLKEAVAAGMPLSEALDGENMSVDFYLPIEGGERISD